MKGRRACVLVVGDAGHSPRILLHTRSLLQSAGYNGVDFIGDLKTGFTANSYSLCSFNLHIYNRQ